MSHSSVGHHSCCYLLHSLPVWNGKAYCRESQPSLMSCFAGMSQTEDFHSCALPLGFLPFAFGTCARSMLDLNFSMSHAVIADLISLQSLLARYPVALLKSRWHQLANCEGKLRLWALLFSHFTFLFVSLWCQPSSDYELWDVFLLLIAV